MSETPIIFQGGNVIAILQGRKTCTRRLNFARWLQRKKGDRLWVKETWCTLAAWDGIKPSDLQNTVQIKYIADNSITAPTSYPWGVIRASMFMPRWASRILLELTEDPHAEPLRDISEADAIAEGVVDTRPQGCAHLIPTYRGTPSSHERVGADSAFKDMWDSINAKTAPWSSNPTVAVVRFRRIVA